MSEFFIQSGVAFSALWVLFVIAVLCSTVVLTFDENIVPVDNALVWFVRVGSILVLAFFGIALLLALIGIPLYYYIQSKTDNFTAFRFRKPMTTAISIPAT
jgi:hypothetical protein